MNEVRDPGRTVRTRGQRGTSLVEFMVTAPLLMLTLSGALDLGRAYYYEVAISDGARAGVRAMIGDYIPAGSLTTGPTFNQICNAVKGELANVPMVSCQQVLHAAPYSAGIDYTPPGPAKAVAVIYCGSLVLSCDLLPVSGGTPVHLTGEVDIIYAFSPTTPLVSGLIPAGTVTLQSRAQGLTNW